MFKRFFFRWILPILCVPGFLARAAGLLVPAYFDPSSGSSPDLWPALTAYHRQLWRIVWVTFFAIGLPGAYIILKPIWEVAR